MEMEMNEDHAPKMLWEVHGLEAFSTKDKIVRHLVNQLGTTDLEFLADLDGSDTIYSLHHGFGTSVRNNYGLWNKDHPLTKVWFQAEEVDDRSHIVDGCDHHPCHPDAVSMDIIKELCVQAKKILASTGESE